MHPPGLKRVVPLGYKCLLLSVLFVQELEGMPVTSGNTMFLQTQRGLNFHNNIVFFS